MAAVCQRKVHTKNMGAKYLAWTENSMAFCPQLYYIRKVTDVTVLIRPALKVIINSLEYEVCTHMKKIIIRWLAGNALLIKFIV